MPTPARRPGWTSRRCGSAQRRGRCRESGCRPTRHARHRRSGRTGLVAGPSPSRRCTASAMISAASSRAARSARFSDAATAAIASGCTKASDPSSVSKARTRRSNASPRADPGPAQEASPIRWPSRRVSSKTSTDPDTPNSTIVSSSARSRLMRYPATSSRRNSVLGKRRRPSKISSGSLRRSIR